MDTNKRVFKNPDYYSKQLMNLLVVSTPRHVSIDEIEHILREIGKFPCVHPYDYRRKCNELYDYDNDIDLRVYDHIDTAHNERTLLLSTLDKLPLKFMIMNKIAPRIVGYLYDRWYKEPPLDDVVDFIPDTVMIRHWLHKYDAVLKEILEKQYTWVYYTSDALEEDVTRLDEYARLCGVTYEKKVPYGAPQSR